MYILLLSECLVHLGKSNYCKGQSKKNVAASVLCRLMTNVTEVHGHEWETSAEGSSVSTRETMTPKDP